MRCRQIRVSWLVVAAGVLWASEARTAAPAGAAPALSYDKIAPGLRERVRQVVEQPTIFCHGPSEVFLGRPALYTWLLDHPDRAALAWKRLGAPCLGITDRGDGRFGYTDTDGNDVSWRTVLRGPRLRVWYAEGSVKPFLLLPAVPVRAVVILRHSEAPDPERRTLIRQQADVYVHTDSKTAELITKILGPSVPRLAEQCISQMELFFSALVWYLDRHPEDIGKLDQ